MENKIKIPETYEEFLELSENEMDYQNKPISESSNIVIKKFGDYLK